MKVALIGAGSVSFSRRLVIDLMAEEGVTPDPGAVNLLGFASGRDLDELTELLDAAGVGVNTVLFPKLTREKIHALPRASTHIALPNALWEHLYQQVSTRSKCELIVAPPPFGWSGTRAWLQTVGRVTGRVEAAERAWAELAAQHNALWERTMEEARRYRLAIVVRPFGELHHLLEPSATWGVPLLATLEEMGFGIDLFLLGHGRAKRVAVEEKVEALFLEPKRHQVRWFTTLDELLTGLRRSEARAVFTNHNFDWRVSQAGKAAFSLQVFEKGLAGGVRTADRILRVCHAPFFARFQRHLERRSDGQFVLDAGVESLR